MNSFIKSRFFFLISRLVLTCVVFEGVARVGCAIALPEVRQSFFLPSFEHPYFAGNDIGAGGSLRRNHGVKTVLVLSGSGAQTRVRFRAWPELLAERIFPLPQIDNFSVPGVSDAGITAIMDSLIQRGIRYDLVLVELQSIVSSVEVPDKSVFAYSNLWTVQEGEWLIFPRIAFTQMQRWLRRDPIIGRTALVSWLAPSRDWADGEAFRMFERKHTIEYSDSMIWDMESLESIWADNARVQLGKARQLGREVVFVGSFMRWREGLSGDSESGFYWLWRSREPGKFLSLRAVSDLTRRRNEVVAGFARQERIAFLDVDKAVDPFRQVSDGFHDQFHLRKRAHEVVAETLAESYLQQSALYR